MQKIVSNCPLCEEHGLHVLQMESVKTMQCLNCGYASSDKYMGTREDNDEYGKLPKEMMSWSKTSDGRIWIPTIVTLPFATLFPFNDEGGKMKWGFAEMVDIEEKDQKNYPDGNGGYYKRRYDLENQKVYDDFLSAMVELNERAKEIGEQTS